MAEKSIKKLGQSEIILYVFEIWGKMHRQLSNITKQNNNEHNDNKQK